MPNFPPHPIYGLLAEFDSVEAITAAAAAVHAAGYHTAQAYTPFPIDALDESLHLPPTKVPLIFLICGIFGAFTGYFMCWYANVISFPLNIGGRPHNSWPAWIPITFELTVLFAGVGGAVGMLARNGLPRLHHPLFAAPGFERATQDRFFLCIPATDPHYDPDAARTILQSLNPLSLTEVPQHS